MVKRYHQLFYGSCAALLYHRVTDLDSDPQLLSVSPSNFDLQLAYLKKNYRILHPNELLELLKSGKRIPRHSILLTFDDGYADNYLEAIPILEKHGLTALFYVCTGNIGSEREFWWDRMERIFLLDPLPDRAINITLGEKQFTLSEGNRKDVYDELLPLLRKMDSNSRDERIQEFALLLNQLENRKTHRSMSTEELKKMAQSPAACIGAHTVGHPSLAALSKEAQMLEIKSSKEFLEELLGTQMIHFSYPFGTKQDYNDDSISICKDLGFELVAANYPYIVNRKSNALAYPRFLVRNWEVDQFKNELEAFYV